MYPLIDKFINEMLPKIDPLAYKAVYPKRIQPEPGYINPKYFAVTLWSEMRIGFEPDMRMLPHLTGLVNTLIHMEYRVPTYFVRSEFAQAVSQTEPPADFKFSEIHWPMPAMLFVLPTDFVMKYFGYMVPFISVTRSTTGVYPDVLKNLPPCVIFSPQGETIGRIQNTTERFNIVYPVYCNERMPVDYTGTYPLNMNVNEIDDAPYDDATIMENERFASTLAQSNMPYYSEALPEGTEEKLFNSKVQAFAVKLMLAITAVPNYIKAGNIARPQKIKKGKVRDELWHPNLIGWEFRTQRPPATGEHGTHASPRLHWRRGHFANIAHGPKNTLRKLKWRLPCLVGVQDDAKPKRVAGKTDEAEFDPKTIIENYQA